MRADLARQLAPDLRRHHLDAEALRDQVTVKISVNGESLRTLQAKHWVIGRKLFQLTVPETVATGSQARIEVRVQLGGRQRRQRTISLDLP